MEDQPDILIYARRLICTPCKPAPEERQEQQYAIAELEPGTGHVALVKEPIEVQKWRRQLVEDKGYAVVVCEWMLRLWSVSCSDVRTRRHETHEAQAGNDQCADGMRQRARSKNIIVHYANHDVPCEISSREGLCHAHCPCVTPNSLPSIHILPLLIIPHYPQGCGAYENRLKQRRDMYVPAYPFFQGQVGVNLRE